MILPHTSNQPLGILLASLLAALFIAIYSPPSAGSAFFHLAQSDSIYSDDEPETVEPVEIIEDGVPAYERKTFRKNFVGGLIVDAGFSIDESFTFMDVPTHMFTSRQTYYIGFDWTTSWIKRKSPHFGRGWFTQFSYWQAGYVLNWEVPDYMSLPPIESSLRVANIGAGYKAHINYGRFVFSPYVYGGMAMVNFLLIFGDESEGDPQFTFDVGVGGEVDLRLIKSLHLTAGYRMTRFIPGTVEFNPEQGVTLTGTFGEFTHEVYFGLALYTGWDGKFKLW